MIFAWNCIILYALNEYVHCSLGITKKVIDTSQMIKTMDLSHYLTNHLAHFKNKYLEVKIILDGDRWNSICMDNRNMYEILILDVTWWLPRMSLQIVWLKQWDF